MKANNFVTMKWTVLFMFMLTGLSLGSCKKDNPDPVITTTIDQTVLIGPKWLPGNVTTTTAAGVSTTKDYTNIPTSMPFLLIDVIFNSNGTAVESDYTTGMTWTLAGSTLKILYGVNGKDGTFNGTINSLSASALVIEIDNYSGNAGTFSKIIINYYHK
jgi:hypothetical protein